VVWGIGSIQMAASQRLRRFGTVRVRLAVLSLLVVAVGLVVGGVIVVELVRHNLTSNVQGEARQRARDTAALLRTGQLPHALPASGEDRTLVQVVDPAGRVIAANLQSIAEAPLLNQRPGGGPLTVTLDHPGLGDGGAYVVVGINARYRAQHVVVYAASSLEPVSEAVQATALGLAVTVPLLLLVVGGTSWVLVGRALRPVEALRKEVSDITASDLDRRVREPEIHDEIGRLAGTMNAMLARLQTAHERQRRFVGDAAHELRSPVANILTQLEVGLAHRKDTDWVRLAQSLHRDGVRLDQLSEQLLVLSRADADAAGHPTQDVDLDELVLAEVEALRARGKVKVELPQFSAARLTSRPEDLRMVVRNLLDNAERHASQLVTVSLWTTQDDVELVIADDGAGIPPDYRERVFERFYRIDSARDRDSGGAGLGLAIVRDVVLGYGGTAWVADSAEGAEFHVRLPIDILGGR
jgi:signal transduction histidine kinase